MTTKRWNAGVTIVLTVLLSILAPPHAGAAGESGAVEAQPAVRAAAVHHIARKASAGSEMAIHVEAIHGVLVADGGLPGEIEILLTNTYISEAIAQVIETGHPLVERVTLTESTFGRDAEAAIKLRVAEGVVAETIEKGGDYAIALRAEARPDQTFTLHLLAKPFPTQPVKRAGSSNLRGSLDQLAAREDEAGDAGWWGEARKAEKPVSVESLVAVRRAEFEMVGLSGERFAAQQADAESAEDTTGAEAPAADDAPDESDAPATEGATPEEAPVAEPPAKREIKSTNSAEANKELARQMITAGTQDSAGEAPRAVEKKPWSGDPLMQPVTIDFRDMDLINAVQILADMAQINVIAGTDLVGTVTLNLKNVPLMQAMETALRINGLGIVEEKGIYNIKPYLDAIASRRRTDVVDIVDGKAAEIVTTLQNVIKGSVYESLISISSNETANTVIIAGPEDQLDPLLLMAKRLDVEQATLPTATLPIKLNYAEPSEMMAAIEGMLTPEIGKASVDVRARVLVVTDIPIVVEQISDLIRQLDLPVKQVAIDAMIVDVTLTDAADTGVDWLLSAVQNQSRRDAAGNTGIFTGNLQELSMGSDLSIGDAAGLLNFGILSGDIDWRGLIQAEVRNNNSTLLSNPKLITVENQTATITIASEIPYTELTSTEQGGQQTSTEFKPIGTTLEVTPKVTHDDHIIAQINAKESTSSQVVNGVPVEDLRQIDTTPHIASGQTIYVGGLRKNNDTVSIRKVPVLGDVPVVNFLFRSNQRSETVNELLIFLTCSVVEGEPQLSDYQQKRVEQVKDVDVKVSAETALINDTVHPSEFRDPAWKWRKNHRPAKAN